MQINNMFVILILFILCYFIYCDDFDFSLVRNAVYNIKLII